MTGSFRLVALHGFLGQASDWEGPAGWLPEAELTALDLWAVVDSPGVEGWNQIGQALDAALCRALQAGDERPAFLVAYSFGARLALASAALAAGRLPIGGACLVSCNPGLAGDDRAARDRRRADDQVWAERILMWPDDEIWRAWNAQPVFAGGSAPPARAGLPASRDVLARALTRFSLAGQPDFRPRLRSWRGPLLWLTGVGDVKFSAIARDLAALGVPATFSTCGDAGHRVPWDNPPAFAGAVRTWITRLTEVRR